MCISLTSLHTPCSWEAAASASCRLSVRWRGIELECRPDSFPAAMEQIDRHYREAVEWMTPGGSA